jgi:hypothetical protein
VIVDDMGTGIQHAEAVQVVAECLAFGLFIYWVGCFWYGILNKNVEAISFRIPSGLDVGEVDDQDLFAIATGNEEYLAAHVTLDTKPVKTKKENKPKEEETNKPDDGLFRDCVAVLISLGATKTEAKKITTEFLRRRPETETVEQFIREHFKDE